MANAAAPYRVTGTTGEWEVVIGLEVHAQITATVFSTGARGSNGLAPQRQKCYLK